MKNELLGTGNSQLLKEYRDTLIKAYCLGEDIKEVYGIVPPKVIVNQPNTDSMKMFRGRVGLEVNGDYTLLHSTDR